MNKAIFLCALVGVFFGTAPLLGRLSSVSAMMMAVLVAAGSLVATSPFAFSQDYAAAGPKGIILGLLAGILNGIGLIAFYQLVAGANKGLWEISKVLPIALALVPIVIAIGAAIFFGEKFTASKIIGVALAGGAIWFLK